MESEAKYALVGTLMLVLVGCIAVAILWLSEAGGLHNKRFFTIYFQEHTLYGLQKDSYVTMRGIKVGSVTDLEISPRNIEQIRVTLMVDEDAPVKTDSVALINRNLLTGFASIDLAKGTKDAAMLTTIPPGEEFPIIPEGRSELEAVADSIPQVVERFGEIAGKLQALMSDQNVAAVSKILADVAVVTDTVARNNKSIEIGIKRLEVLADELSKISTSVRGLTESSDAQIRRIATEFEGTLGAIRESIKQLDTKGGELIQTMSSSMQVISQGIGDAVQNIGEAASALSAAVAGFEQPRKILTGPHKEQLGPGESR